MPNKTIASPTDDRTGLTSHRFAEIAKAAELQHPGSTLRAKLRTLPELMTEGLRPAQIIAIRNLEASLAQDRPRALIQMASGGGKTFTACNFIYRLIKHAGAKRILFLVDRSNLGRQALAEFQKFRTPEENRLFTELYNVQRMQSNKLDDVSKVCITTIQRLYGKTPEHAQANLRVREYATDAPLTDAATSERIAKAVAARGLQVFVGTGE